MEKSAVFEQPKFSNGLEKAFSLNEKQRTFLSQINRDIDDWLIKY